MTREEAIRIAEEFSEWLEDMSEKYGLDKDDVQALIKRFLMQEAEDADCGNYQIKKIGSL